jgi:hypothetical protein
MRKLMIGGALLALLTVPTVSASAAPASGAAINDAARSDQAIQDVACKRIEKCVMREGSRRCTTIVKCGEGGWRRGDRDGDRRGERRRRDYD